MASARRRGQPRGSGSGRSGRRGRSRRPRGRRRRAARGDGPATDCSPSRTSGAPTGRGGFMMVNVLGISQVGPSELTGSGDAAASPVALLAAPGVLGLRACLRRTCSSSLRGFSGGPSSSAGPGAASVRADARVPAGCPGRVCYRRARGRASLAVRLHHLGARTCPARSSSCRSSPRGVEEAHTPVSAQAA